MTTIINFSGEPSSGKSTAANALFSHLKQIGYNVEIVTEHSKMLAYQGSNILNQDQMYVFANQHNLMFIMTNQLNSNSQPLDYIITDSPLYLSYIYGKYHQENQIIKNLPIELPETFFQMVIDTYKQYDNVNILMERNHNFGLSKGRFHNEEESQDIKNKIIQLLSDMDEDYITFKTQNLNNDSFNLGKTLYEVCLDNQLIIPLPELQKQQQYKKENELIFKSCLIACANQIISNSHYSLDDIIYKNLSLSEDYLDNVKLYKNNDITEGVKKMNDYINQHLNQLNISTQVKIDLNINKENYLNNTINIEIINQKTFKHTLSFNELGINDSSMNNQDFYREYILKGNVFDYIKKNIDIKKENKLQMS